LNADPTTCRADDSRRNLLYLLFAASGFAGLIYESIWSHYLGLFLGHSAHAQTLVLVIFMGGMAAGAWLASRHSGRSKNLLVAYAVTEAIVGVCALLFHEAFVAATDLAYATVMPQLGSPLAVRTFKSCVSAGLILPQSILLGATFPLMSAGLLRLFPARSGATLALLYFTNSLGGGLGVLASGFVLTGLVGLTGTLRVAGLANLAIAATVWLLARGVAAELPRTRLRPAGPGSARSWWPLLAVACLTGAASFIYEIGWIRMLSLVLGGSTHAFEMMLSAFILGLAGGGLWIRRRIDRLRNPLVYLARIQLLMGLCALGTLVAYNRTFELMRVLMEALERTPAGYHLFNLGSHGIALCIMLPATFCAGMTLPLITHLLLRRGQGEQSIGAVYAANTVGAIVGIVYAVHVGLPVSGLEGLISTGAALDLLLGVLLLGAAGAGSRRWGAPLAALLAGTAVAGVLAGVRFDRARMISGVYRYGTLFPQAAVEFLYHEDGKTATVDLVRHASGNVSIRTNGKSDALINPDPAGPPADDETTNVLLAAIPLALHPQARTVANIGVGSGLTVEVLLGAPAVERVDTIEIEAAMVDAARLVGPRVAGLFGDPRSRIHIDDARSFFAATGLRYDLILSEPSNPWVSGVAGLFTDEFYRRVRSHLSPEGLLAQWIQLYELDLDLVASVMKALGRNFEDYVVYAANDSEIVVVARRAGRLAPADPSALAPERVARELGRIDIRLPRDLALRRLGDRALLEALFESFPARANSDFFPVLDLGAVRSRFLRESGSGLARLGSAPLPILELLDSAPRAAATLRVTPSRTFERSRRAHAAIAVHEFYARGAPAPGGVEQASLAGHLALTRQLGAACAGAGEAERWLGSAFAVAGAAFPHLAAPDADGVWQHWRTSDCHSRLAPAGLEWLELLRAVGRRDPAGMAVRAQQLLVGVGAAHDERQRYLLGAGMLGALALGRAETAWELWTAHAPAAPGDDPPDLALRLLAALAAQRSGRASLEAVQRRQE